ncbi:hypothetical protein BRY73_14170 [Ochrobactrum sp. P6BS-III]|nr:hypothetical protein BRY73_14170 [Ochrobactrum sp. P6BS-III]
MLIVSFSLSAPALHGPNPSMLAFTLGMTQEISASLQSFGAVALSIARNIFCKTSTDAGSARVE